MQRQGGFYQPCHRCCGLEVADHGLDRPDGTELSLGGSSAKHPHERLDLCPVAGHRPRTMGLDQAHRRRGEFCLAVSPLQSANLARWLGSRKSLSTSIAGAANGLDHSVDAVPIALGIGQPLQHYHTNPLPDDGPVSALVESTAPTAR